MDKPTTDSLTKTLNLNPTIAKSRVGLSLILAFVTSVAYGQDYRLVSVQPLVPSPYGGRAAWSPGPNNLIAYDSLNSTTGFYDVWTMNPDGSNQTCITCNWQPPPVNGVSNPQPYYNKGNPDWDPTGTYIVFEVQRNDTTYTSSQQSNSRPGVGEDLTLWIMDAQGVNHWPVAASMNYSPHDGGVLHPRFSHNSSSRGLMLLWAQETSNGSSNFNGIWEMQVASFTIANGQPAVSLLTTVSPGGSEQCQGPFYETHGFSLDDSTIFYSGNPQAGCSGPTLGYDEYSYNLNTQVYADLTNTPDAWEEHARPSPVQDKLLYVSSFGLDSSLGNLLQEYWTMNYNGSDKKKITWVTDPRGQFFNAAIPNFYIPGSSSVGRCDWSHDGLQAVVYFADKAVNGESAFGQAGSLWELTLEPSSTTGSTASYLTFPQAPDSIALSFGTDLANGTATTGSVLGTNLAGTTVNVQDSQGVSRPANIFFADANQVNWEVPTGTALGPAIVTTTSGDGTQTTDIFDVEDIAPGLFGADSSGSGPAAGYVLPGGQFTFQCAEFYQCSTTPINVSSGQTYLVLFGTGLQSQLNRVFVNITNQDGNLLSSSLASFAGAQGAYAGLDQVNVELPTSLAGAGIVNVSLVVGNVFSNSVQIQIQ